MLRDADMVTRWAADGLLTGSVHGAIVIALIWLATRAVSTVPASVQAALWWLATLKLLLALLPLPALSLPLLPADGGSTPVAAALEESKARPPSVDTGTARQGAALPLATPGSRDTGSSWWLGAVVGAWLLGLGFHAIRLLAVFRSMRAVVRRAAPATAEDAAVLERLAHVIGLKHVPELRVSREIDTPQVAGVRRPIVLVPADAAALAPRDRMMALCHELVHVRRHDLVFGWVPALAVRLFFFHPLAHVAAREYITAREAACDAVVVRTLGLSPHEYGRLLVRVGVAGSACAFAARGASLSISSLRRRLEMLQHVPPGAVPRRRAWCVATAAFVAMLPFQLVARTPSAQTEPSAPRAERHAVRLRVIERPAAPRSAVSSPRHVAPAAPSFSVASARAAGRLREPGHANAVMQNAEATAEQHAVHEERRALENVHKVLAEQQEAMRRSLLEQRQRLDAELDALQKSLSKRTAVEAARARAELLNREHRETLRTLQEAQALDMRLQLVHKQLAQLAARLQALERQRQLHTERFAAARGRSEAYARGDVVTLAPAADGSRPPDARVLAVPGDRVEVARGGILVNGVAVTGFSSDFFAGLPENAWERTVPPAHYFVASERRYDAGASRFWGLVAADGILGKH